MKNIFFKPEEWQFDSGVNSCVGGIKTVKGFDGKDTEAWQLADWNWSWTSLRTVIDLAPDTEYIFTFWLNGGENARCDEVCNLEIWFGDDWDGRLMFKLNRDFFMPTLVKNGWYLFSVPFTTPSEGTTTMRFNAMGAVVTIAPAKSAMEYEDIEGDEDSNGMPQRPNIVFENGYPEEQKEQMLSMNFFGKKFETTPSQVKKTLKILGGVLAAVVVARGVIRKVKNKNK